MIKELQFNDIEQVSGAAGFFGGFGFGAEPGASAGLTGGGMLGGVVGAYYCYP